MSVFWFQLPHVLVRILNVVVADLLENLLEISRRLSRLSDQVLDVVILMLLEQGEQNFLDLAYFKRGWSNIDDQGQNGTEARVFV